MYKK
jgi:NAD+ synthase (glutamine-hydrolysing)